ncbi:MAG: glycosyltransferase family 4 protein [Candidatus Omnitrophica bacterium]|nr:glycosyltransferase family 4 protein [Candidatus Omnitrophota bacterium]
MRILIVHNRYKDPGGEDAVVRSERALLENFGEEVFLYERDNAEFDSRSILRKVSCLRTFSWSDKTYKEITDVIREFRPDIAHFHNIFYAISPSAYQACKDENVPVVQSLHNFRLFCANGLFFRDNKVCEDCVRKSWREGIVHRCFRKSAFMTALIIGMISKHWKEGTWSELVDRYITASSFGRMKMIEAGIPEGKITVKPNFVYPDPGFSDEKKEFALYVGRLREEKGVDTLVQSWEKLPDVPLRIIGDGPMLNRLRALVDKRKISNVEFLGHVSQGQYEVNMRKARFLVVPSICYENFPRIVAEAFAFGIPVIASRLGSLAEIIEDGKTGLLFTPGDASDLGKKVRWMMAHDDGLAQMGKETRQMFEEKYTDRKNYRSLMEIYGKTLGQPCACSGA